MGYMKMNAAILLLNVVCLCTQFLRILPREITDVYVMDNIADTLVNNKPASCSSPSSSCNLRSAFGYCIEQVFTSPSAICAIHLYVGVSIPFNSSLGALNYSADTANYDNQLHIYGNGSVVTSLSSSTSMAGFIYLSNTYLTINNLMVKEFSNLNGNGSVLSADGAILNVYNSTFKNNVAANGGAVYASRNSTLSIVDCIFTSNFASEYGGSIAVGYNSTVNIKGSMFDTNQATIGGGAVSIYEDNHYATIANNVFMRNIAITNYADKTEYDTYGGGAVFVYQHNMYLILRNNTFHENRADYNNATYVSYTVGLGGAVTFVRYNDYALIESCYFQGNFGLFGGGAFLSSYNDFVMFLNNTFSHNQAHENMTNYIGGDGGAMDIVYMNNYVTIEGCNFDSNLAKGAGGAIKLNSQNQNSRIFNSNFTNNTLDVDSLVGGGAVHMNYGNVNVTVENCLFDSNVANTAAGIYVSRVNKNVQISKCLFKENNARSYHGGGLCIRYLNRNVNVNQCQFYRNRAHGGSGGGAILILDYNTDVLIQNSILDGNSFNSHTYGGGAISIYQTNTKVTLLNLTIQNSISSSDGGGLFVYGNNSYVTVAGCQIANNYAQNGGGLYLDQLNDNFVIVSSSVYKQTQVVQTTHPYQSLPPQNNVPQIILNQTITIEDADELIIVFDSQTELSGNDPFSIWTNSSKEELLFMNNQYDPWPGIARPPLRFRLNSIFIELSGPTFNFKMKGEFYGFKMTVYPSGVRYMNNADSMISYNNADREGGGGKIYFLNDNSIVIATIFRENTAHDGGATYIQSVNGGLMIARCMFMNNKAHSGGGLLLSSSNYGAGLFDSIFKGNTADQTGGGMYVVTGNGEGLYVIDNHVNVSGVSFTNNSAFSGGSIYLGAYNSIMLTDVNFTKSIASRDGGAIYADAGNDIVITTSTFQENYAANAAGGVLLVQSNTMIMTDGVLSKNVAFLGGGMAILNESKVTFTGDIEFVENVGHMGGGIALRSTQLWSMTSNAHMTLDSNVAYLGSAVAFANVETSTEYLRNLTIINNQAKQGGTIYWLYGRNNVSDEPRGLHSSDITWSSNKALYGDKWATQTVTFSLDVYTVTEYNAVLSPPYSLNCKDYYGNEVKNENQTIASIRACSDCPHDCNGNFFSITGQLTATSVNGVLEWKDIRASCYPKGNFTASIDGVTPDPDFFGLTNIEQYAPNGKEVMIFRNCYDGEYLDRTSGACVPCVYGFYSYQFHPSQLCAPCPPEATQCEKNLTDLKSSFWRSSTYSTTFLSCPYDTCIGGTGVSDELCRIGSTGALCATCVDGYYYDSQRQQCVECTAPDSYISETLIVIIVLCCISIVIVVYIVYVKYILPGIHPQEPSRDEMDNEDNAPNKETNTDIDENTKVTKVRRSRKPTWHDVFGAYLTIRFRDLAANFKIIVATLQILIAVPNAFVLTWPNSYSKFLGVFQIMNVNVNTITNWNCANYTYDYIDRLVVITLTPFGILAMFFVFFVVQSFHIRNKILRKNNSESTSGVLAEIRKEINKLRCTYVSISLVLTFLILPSISTIIFGMYGCDDIDPNGQSSNDLYGRYYLRRDYSIECTSSKYRFGVVWASIMVVAYPIGIPLLNFWLLYKRRFEIKHRLDPPETGTLEGGRHEYIHTISTVHILSDDTRMVEFLYRSYLPRYWYFECIETFRRLFLTAFISIISPGSSEQLLVAIVMSFVFLRIYSKLRPFLEYGTVVLSQVANHLVFFTYVGATFVGKGLLSADSADIISALLLAGTLCLILLAIMYELNNYRGYLAYRRMLDSEDDEDSQGTNDEDNKCTEGTYEEHYEVFVANNTHMPLTKSRGNKGTRFRNKEYGEDMGELETDRSSLGKLGGIDLDQVNKLMGANIKSFQLPVFEQERRRDDSIFNNRQSTSKNPMTK